MASTLDTFIRWRFADQPGEVTICLEARDLARNIARSYAVHMAPDLFGAWIVECNWGRIGSRGTSSRHSFSEHDKAASFVRSVMRRRAGARRRIGVDYVVTQSQFA